MTRGFSRSTTSPPATPGFSAVDTSHGKLGNLVCWDQWFPEAARLTALAGAQVLLYPTAIGHDNDPEHGDTELAPVQFDAWRTVMRSHAIANGVYVAAINRIGVEDGLTFWGGSFVCGPDGQDHRRGPARQGGGACRRPAFRRHRNAAAWLAFPA